MADYRIEFTIQRRTEGTDDGDDDFTEIGFGASSGWGTVKAALYEVESMVDNYEWENEPGQPDPGEIRRDEEVARENQP
jgi:hypothetical protein